MAANIFRRIFRSPFTPLYSQAQLLPEIQKGLRLVILGNLFGNIFGTISTGSTLTGYAGMLGANDFVFGVLTAIPFLGTIMQVPAAYIVSKTSKRKEYMLIFGTISRLLWLVIGLVPLFLPVNPQWLRIWTVIFLIGISSISSSFINVSFTSWLADLVPIRIRGRWLSGRDKIISVVSIIAGLLTAAVLDMSEGFAGYVIVIVLGGILGVLDMACFAKVPDVPMKKAPDFNYRTVIREMFADKPFYKFMIFWTVWCFCSNFYGAYVNRYALGPLGLSFMQVTLCGQVAAAVVTVLLISRWGRVIDRYGSKPTLWVSCILNAFIPGVFAFSQPGSVVTYLLFNVLGASVWIAANLAAQNMLLSLSPSGQRPSYIAIHACFTSIAGSFFGVLAGGAFLQWMPEVFPVNPAFDQYKIMFTAGVVMRLAVALIYIPGLTNDNESSFDDMKRDFFAWFRRAFALIKARRMR